MTLQGRLWTISSFIAACKSLVEGLSGFFVLLVGQKCDFCSYYAVAALEDLKDRLWGWPTPTVVATWLRCELHPPSRQALPSKVTQQPCCIITLYLSSFLFQFPSGSLFITCGLKGVKRETPKFPGWKHLQPLPVRSWRRASPVTTNYTRWYWYHSLHPYVYVLKESERCLPSDSHLERNRFRSSHLAITWLASTALLVLFALQQGFPVPPQVTRDLAATVPAPRNCWHQPGNTKKVPIRHNEL